MTELKEKYESLIKKSLLTGLTDEECIIMGRAFRILSYEIRKKILLNSGWKDDLIYKHVKTKDGLMKTVIDKRAMAYERKKRGIWVNFKE